MIPIQFWRWCRHHPRVSVFFILSLLALVAAFLGFNRRVEELKPYEAMSHQLRLALTVQIAERINNDLHQLAMIPQTMAATLSLREDWRHEQMLPWMRQMLEKDKRLLGTCVAFEPYQFHDKVEDYAPYLCRTESSVVVGKVGYVYRDKEWYTAAKEKQDALWTEPFFDLGPEGTQVFMVTHTVPIWRQRRSDDATEKRFVGVATADIDLAAYFAQVRSWLDKVNLGKDGYNFILNSTGTLISHPKGATDPEFQAPKNIADLAAFREVRGLKLLAQRLLNQETGSARLVDPFTGELSSFYFAPIPSVRWMFVAVVVE